MKKQSQDQTNEQLHIDDAAAAQEEYSLEDIMNEFGGWSKKEEAAPKQQAQTPPDPKKPPQKVPESSKARAGDQGCPLPEGAAHPRRGRAQRAEEPRGFQGPDHPLHAHPRGYRAGREAEDLDVSGGARPRSPCPMIRRKQRKRRSGPGARKKEAKKRQKQLERHQKQQAKRMERRKEQPEREFPDCRAAYTYYAQGTFQRLRLFLSILLAIVSGASRVPCELQPRKLRFYRERGRIFEGLTHYNGSAGVYRL